MRTLNKTKVICLTALSLLAISCDEEDRSTKFTDMSLEDVESVWRVQTSSPYEGISLSDDCVLGYDTTIARYLFFFNDGTGVSYYFYRNAEPDSTLFNYQTDDACHVSIKSDERCEHWTFAKITFHSGGRWKEKSVIYTDSLVNGNKLYTWYYCDEIRTDSTLYSNTSYFRRWRHVPENRVWKDKDIAGEYSCTGSGEMGIMNVTFKTNGEFRYDTYVWGEPKNGRYEIITGAPDSLYLVYNDGRTSSYPIVIEKDRIYIYDGEIEDSFSRI